MAVNENLTGYSRTASSNTPAGSDSIGTDLDDHLRDIKKNILYASQTPIEEKSTTYSAVLTDHTKLLLIDASAGAVTVVLPAVATAGDGYVLGVKKIDSSSNVVTVDGDGAETIDDTASYGIDVQNDASVLVCDGTAWRRLDSLPPSNVPFVDTEQEWTKAQNFNATSLTDTATISWVLADNQVAKVTLGGNRTLANPTGMKDGATYILKVKQDNSGSRTLAFDTQYLFPSGIAPTLSISASAEDILAFISLDSSMYGLTHYNFS